MDPVSDPIEASWWEDVLGTASLDAQFEPAELLSSHFERAAKDPATTGFQELVLQVLAEVTSAMLSPDGWDEPFDPSFVFNGRRSLVPADLSADRVALLARIAPLVVRDDLRARVADVAWFYGDRSDVAMLERAVDAYRAAPLASDGWFSAGRDAWVRALELVIRRGAAGHTWLDEMSDALKAEVLAGTVGDNFRTPGFAQVLRQHGRVDKSGRAEVCDALFDLAAAAAGVDARLSRHLEREAIAWLGGSDQAEGSAATERIARTYIAEADARVKTDPEAGALVEGHFLEKAIAVLRTVPRSYRVANGLEDLIDDLRIRLRDSREASLEQMVRLRSDPIDLTSAVSYARKKVSGHTDLFDALAAFATLTPPLDEGETRHTAGEMLDGAIGHAFGSFTISSDFRKVASRTGSGGEIDESVVWAEMVKVVIHHSQFVAKGIIAPALEVLNSEYRFGRRWLVSLCAESPTVPEGHQMLWGTGLALGLAGNHAGALSILVPQLEQVVRVMLHRNAVHTLHVDEQGVESEKSLNVLLDMPETETIFGSGIVMEMKALLIEQGGPNLRNDIAHGLLNDGTAWSHSALFMWWFCLRLVMYPLIEMVQTVRAHESDEAAPAANTESADAGSSDEGSESATAEPAEQRRDGQPISAERRDPAQVSPDDN